MEQSPETNPMGAKETVLAKIQRREVSMRPKFYFTAETILAGFVALLILLVSVGLLNFIFFGLRLNGHESLLNFGPQGIALFFFIFPWPLLALDVLLVLFLETLLRRFKFGYRAPVLYLLLGLLAVSISAGLALDRGTSLNDLLFTRAEHGELPSPFAEFYEGVPAAAPHEEGIFRGTITDVGTSTFMLRHDDFDRDTDETIYTVVMPDGFPTSTLSAGERVYVAGQARGSTITPYGIRVLPPPPGAESDR